MVVFRPLRIGLFTSDNFFSPCTAVARSLQEAKAALEAAGHEVVECAMPRDGWDISRLYFTLMGADGNMSCLLEGLDGEALLDTYKSLKRLADLPNFIRKLVRPLLWLVGEHRLAHISTDIRSGGLSALEYYDKNADLINFQKAYVSFMATQRLDAILCPTLPFPAFKHRLSKELTPCLCFTFLANLLRWPAGVVPTTTVRPGEDFYDVESLPPRQKDSMTKFAIDMVEGSVGLPLTVQILALPNQDELCLHIMKVLEQHLAFDIEPPLASSMVVTRDDAAMKR